MAIVTRPPPSDANAAMNDATSSGSRVACLKQQSLMLAGDPVDGYWLRRSQRHSLTMTDATHPVETQATAGSGRDQS